MLKTNIIIKIEEELEFEICKLSVKELSKKLLLITNQITEDMTRDAHLRAKFFSR